MFLDAITFKNLAYYHPAYIFSFYMFYCRKKNEENGKKKKNKKEEDEVKHMYGIWVDGINFSLIKVSVINVNVINLSMNHSLSIKAAHSFHTAHTFINSTFLHHLAIKFPRPCSFSTTRSWALLTTSWLIQILSIFLSKTNWIYFSQ